MGNRTLLSILFGLLLVSTALFGQGSDWQYANVFNIVEGDYGSWIPSWYRTDFSVVSSFTPATPSIRTAFMRTPAGDDEMPVPVNHDQVVLRMDLLSGTEDNVLRGVTVTLWGSPDFDPNEDLAPVHPDSARDLYCESDTTKHSYTGFQFYIEKGLAAGSNVDSLDARDIYGIPEVLLINPDVIEVGTPPVTVDITPAYLWEDVTGTTGHTSPYASWNEWRITFYFKDGIRIPYEATHRTDLYGLPFYRIWVVMKPVGCHECAESSRDGMMIEGLSNRDSLYVEIHDPQDLFIYNYLGVDPVSGIEIVDTIDMSISRDEIRWNTPDPTEPEAQRWASSELLIGGDTIPPFITDLIPRNEVLTNGDETDFIEDGVVADYGCDEPGEEIWTADSCQPISFVAYDKSTCIDSVFVELRYINDGIPTFFPRRVDSIYFRSAIGDANDENGGPGDAWEVNVRPYLGSWTGWEYVWTESSEFEVVQSGMCADGYCGHDTFFIDIARDSLTDYLEPFIDGAHVQVTVRVFNRNYNVGTTSRHSRPYAYDAYQDTVWTFYIDLSGPNAELVCPGESDDNLTEEFYGGSPGWRQDNVEGEWIDWRFVSDSLPLVQIHLYDNYGSVHDAMHHDDPLPFWTGAEGGCGINQRDFEFTFILHRLVCDEDYYYITDTFYVDDDDLGMGCWFDEDDNGEEGTMWIDFESLFTYRTDLTGTLLDYSYMLPFRSGDIIEIQLTQLFDDPDYGQGSQRYDAFGWFHTGISDLDMDLGGYSYGDAGNPDGNYGVRNRRELSAGDQHIPVDARAAAIYGVDPMVDTLGFVRIDLAGPVAPDSFFYPPNGWVTSDTLQVITVDIYDQIGCDIIDQRLDRSYTDLDDYVAGVYGQQSDLNSRIAINLQVQGCDGSWHPDYVDAPARPWEGRTWYVPGWTTNCASQPHHIEKINDRWGTRLTFAPRQHEPFRSGDKVCVTVYAYDNAVTDCPYDTLFTTDLLCADGSTWHTVENWIPDRNEGVDILDPDWLYRTQRQIARFTFYVDVTPPQFVESSIYPICDDTLTFTIRDYSDAVGPVWCDEWVAGIGAADLRIWIYDDDEAGSNDFVFFNDLVPGVPVGATKIDTTTGLMGREDRYIYARMDFGVDPAREAIIKVWKDCNDQSCHFFEPDDSVVIEIWAGDNPNVPWYAATRRPLAEEGYHANMAHSTAPHQAWWWHYYNPAFPLLGGDDYWMSPCAGWRRGTHSYTDLNHDWDGITWVDTAYYNYENPNWDKIHEQSFIVQSEIWVKEIRWFNDSAWAKWNDAGFGSSVFWNYEPDLAGIYTHADEIADTSRPVYSDIAEFDPYLTTYARDLQFITAEVYTCTDSIVRECYAESWPHDDTLTGRTPYVSLELFDSEGEVVWTFEDHWDCHCDACVLHYEPLRDCCKDGGIIKIGPINQMYQYMYTLRDSVSSLSELHPDQRWEVARVETLSTDPLVVDSTIYVYGYMDGDSLSVTFGVHSRNPNQFGDTIEYHVDYHEYRWFYNIDMQPPTARFRRLEGTRGYAEVDCEEMHVDNNQVNIRLESIDDGDGVGLHPGGTDASWTSSWPIPIIKPGTDIVDFVWGSAAPRSAGLDYADDTHYIYSNLYVVTNCTEEDTPARMMTLASPISLYSGLETSGATPTPILSNVLTDTIWIGDSLYVEATIQDRLGNEQWLRSNNLGLDNGLPEVKGFAFASYDLGTDTYTDWDPDFALLPWMVPDQESLVGVYNFDGVCTVYVRLWFTDNMDMREADVHTGYIVRFQPEGWTHWFPVMPVPTHAGFYPLAQRYVNYNYGPGGALLRAVDGADEADISDEAETMFYDNGWNTDREWIGFFVVAEDMMDGVAKLRVQGFDDNAGNNMLERDFLFRIETQYEDPCMYWPDIDRYDTEPIDPWTGEMDDQLVVTGYSQGSSFCTTEPTMDCFPVTSDCFDRTITDSVGFDFWWSDDPLSEGELPIESIDTVWDGDVIDHIDTTFSDPDFHYIIDDMGDAELIWEDPDGEHWWAQTPCDVIDIIHQYAVDGTIMDLVLDEKYVTIRFRGYSRFYPDHYLEDFTWNVLVDNENRGTVLTTEHGGDIPPGSSILIIPSVTEEIRICIDGAQIEQVDYVEFYWTDMVTDVETSITGGFLPVGVEGIDPMYFATPDNVICFDWETPDGLEPGIFTLGARGYNEIHIVEDINSMGEITSYHTYSHNFCFERDSILVPNEAFLARGDGYDDAVKTVCDNYPEVDYCADIYPWTGEEYYPDWPAWTHVDATIVDEHPHVNRFQITTFTNPDYTEGEDPFLHPYIETGGYPGDSLFILFRRGDVLYVDMRIEDEFGGNISGSNLEIFRRLGEGDIRMYQDAEHFVYNWVVDDQDNRYDGPVRVTFTTYRENFAGDTVVTDHVTFFLLDTYDPEYRVEITRYTGDPLRLSVSEDYPHEDIWVTNADTVNLNIEWMQTIFDQAPTEEGFIDYNMYETGRNWEHLRLTIDGEPHHGFEVSDPNDLEMARLWQHDFAGPISVFDPFWLDPGPAPIYPDFADDMYLYEWTVSNDLRGQGIARILVKGRDHAGNILTYDEAGLSESYGKFVLIDVEAPTIDADLISITAAEFNADEEAIDDNFLGEGFRDPVSGGYVFINIWDRAHTTELESEIWVSDDGSVTDELVTLTAGDTVLVCAVDLAGNETCVEVEVMPHEECCTYELVDGFNMIAISVEPVVATDLEVGVLFPYEDVYTLVGGSYIPVPSGTILSPNAGYLVMATVPRTVTLCGSPVESFVASGLAAGWNLIGGPWTTVAATDAGVYPSGAIDMTNLHYYDGERGEYVPTTEFAHCRGHLVMVTSSEEATIMVPDTVSTKTVVVHKNRTAPEVWTASFNVETDGLAREITFGIASDATAGIDLGHDAVLFPTLPGTDDVYFDNHMSKSIVRDNNQVEWDLVITDNATLRINLDNVPADWNVMLEGIDLRQTGTLNLEAGTYKVTASIQAVPDNYMLAQNRPNPFNPTTDINYSVPSEGLVQIAVFNVLGEEIKTLVNGVQEAGSRTVTWDGTDKEGNRVESGIYFYKMTAGGYTDTHKMTLIK